MIDFERVVREAAIKNKIVIHKDDPVMLLASTINIMLEDLNSSLAAALEKYQATHEDIARRWRHDASVGADKILNAALEAGREATARTMNEGAEKVTRLIGEEMHAALLRQQMELDSVVTDVRRHTMLMLLASGMVLGAAVLLSLM